MDALCDNTHHDPALKPPDEEFIESEDYQPGSAGVNLALGQNTVIQRGSHRHPDWPPQAWKILPPDERKRMTKKFFEGIRSRLDDPRAIGPDGIRRDYWKITGNVLERVHVVVRKTLFDPSSVADIPVNVELLRPHRSTVQLYDDGSFSRRDADNWRLKGVARQPTKWLWSGYSILL